jgi:predicted nucleotidyltransferase
MTQQEIHKKIRNTVDSLLPGTRIVLFGSRARGDFDGGSDYDLLIITPAKYERREQMGWRTRLARALVHTLNASFDVLMNDQEELVANQQLLGHVVRSAMREGIDI